MCSVVVSLGSQKTVLPATLDNTVMEIRSADFRRFVTHLILTLSSWTINIIMS